jgi:hypothetical protein
LLSIEETRKDRNEEKGEGKGKKIGEMKERNRDIKNIAIETLCSELAMLDGSAAALFVWFQVGPPCRAVYFVRQTHQDDIK